MSQVNEQLEQFHAECFYELHKYAGHLMTEAVDLGVCSLLVGYMHSWWQFRCIDGSWTNLWEITRSVVMSDYSKDFDNDENLIAAHTKIRECFLVLDKKRPANTN